MTPKQLLQTRKPWSHVSTQLLMVGTQTCIAWFLQQGFDSGLKRNGAQPLPHQHKDTPHSAATGTCACGGCATTSTQTDRQSSHTGPVTVPARIHRGLKQTPFDGQPPHTKQIATQAAGSCHIQGQGTRLQQRSPLHTPADCRRGVSVCCSRRLGYRVLTTVQQHEESSRGKRGAGVQSCVFD